MNERQTEKLSGEVTSWDISQVHPYEGNAKIHDEAQVKKIAASIEQFGFDQPIVVDGAGVIIKGHGRRLAAIYLKRKKVPVLVRIDMTAKEANASRIADNRTAVGDVDTDILNAEMMELADDTDLLDALGMSDKELEFMTEDLGEINTSVFEDEDDTPSTSVADSKDDSESARKKRVPIKDVLGFGFFEAEDAAIVARWLSTMRGVYEVDSSKTLYAVAKDYFDRPIE